MATDIVQCTECQTKNRLRPADGSGKLPRCGQCKTPLPWLVDATDASFEAESKAPVPVLVAAQARGFGSLRRTRADLGRIPRGGW